MTDAIKLAIEALKDLNPELICIAAHHAKKDQHALNEECPVAARYTTALAALRAQPAKPLEWHYGPTDADSEPGKRWHNGCGGEIWGFKEGDICNKCNQADDAGLAQPDHSELVKRLRDRAEYLRDCDWRFDAEIMDAGADALEGKAIGETK